MPFHDHLRLAIEICPLSAIPLAALAISVPAADSRRNAVSPESPLEKVGASWWIEDGAEGVHCWPSLSLRPHITSPTYNYV